MGQFRPGARGFHRSTVGPLEHLLSLELFEIAPDRLLGHAKLGAQVGDPDAAVRLQLLDDGRSPLRYEQGSSPLGHRFTPTPFARFSRHEHGLSLLLQAPISLFGALYLLFLLLYDFLSYPDQGRGAFFSLDRRDFRIFKAR